MDKRDGERLMNTPHMYTLISRCEGGGELVQPARDTGRERYSSRPRRVDLRISGGEMPKKGAVLGVSDVFLRVWAALPGLAPG